MCPDKFKINQNTSILNEKPSTAQPYCPKLPEQLELHFSSPLLKFMGWRVELRYENKPLSYKIQNNTKYMNLFIKRPEDFSVGADLFYRDKAASF